MQSPWSGKMGGRNGGAARQLAAKFNYDLDGSQQLGVTRRNRCLPINCL